MSKMNTGKHALISPNNLSLLSSYIIKITLTKYLM
uniref:Uncharacterized protein n=1 Tax=Anguilla anguilla TaxID=7936 RepID=A0A0E9ST84_ANGAN